MIKGCEKKIIMLEGNESSVFECAYFVMRKNAGARGDGERDMIREANRIVELCLPGGMLRAERKKRLRSFLCRGAIFLLGALLGAGIFTLADLLFVFFA